MTVPTRRASRPAEPSQPFYDLVAQLAGLRSEAEAKQLAVVTMRDLLGRLTRQSAGVVAGALPAPMHELFDAELGTALRFAPFGALVADVAGSVGVNSQAARRYLRALGAALEQTLTPEALERLRAEIPQIAREILPSYKPVSSERPSVLRSSAVEPLCTAPIDPDDRAAFVRRRAV